jgi:AraC-like DNA-binding protein
MGKFNPGQFLTMKLVEKTSDNKKSGKTIPLPAALQKQAVSWANPVYTLYPFGYTIVQELDCPGFSVYNWKMNIERPVRLFAICEKPTLALEFNFGDTIDASLTGYGEKKVEANTCELFYVPISENPLHLHKGHYHSVHIEFEPSYLDGLAPAHPSMAGLIHRVEAAGKEGSPLAAVSIRYILKDILQNLLQCPASGGLLLLEMKKFFHQLLSEYIAGLRETSIHPEKSGTRTIGRVKEFILQEPNIHRHSIKNIAHDFGINRSALERQFVQQEGIPLAHFVRLHALTRAHRLIISSNRTIDDIAAEMGYSLRGNFDRAFKRQFGYTAAALRLGKNDTA